MLKQKIKSCKAMPKHDKLETCFAFSRGDCPAETTYYRYQKTRGYRWKYRGVTYFICEEEGLPDCWYVINARTGRRVGGDWWTLCGTIKEAKKSAIEKIKESKGKSGQKIINRIHLLRYGVSPLYTGVEILSFWDYLCAA